MVEQTMKRNTTMRAAPWVPNYLALAAAIIAVSLTVTAAGARPRELNLALDRKGDEGVFQIELVSGQVPIPMSKVHQWSVHLSGAGGAPVFGATIKIDGGMPEHGHGLPTAPRAEAAAAPGDYVIKGMKFSMPGWWVLKLDIRVPDGRTDKITFNLIL
jgi:YtkA-like